MDAAHDASICFAETRKGAQPDLTAFIVMDKQTLRWLVHRFDFLFRTRAPRSPGSPRWSISAALVMTRPGRWASCDALDLGAQECGSMVCGVRE
jgi:hypothetical protein